MARSDDFRTPKACKDGGFELLDKNITGKLRSAGKEVVKSVGKAVLSGKFNLTNISFPIKCMQPTTILQAVASIAGIAPYLLTAAGLQKDPVEKMKLLMTFCIAHLNVVHSFEKPLNPILGETYVAELADGTCVYVE